MLDQMVKKLRTTSTFPYTHPMTSPVAADRASRPRKAPAYGRGGAGREA